MIILVIGLLLIIVYEGKKTMATVKETVEDIEQSITELTATLAEVNSKLDEVRDYISTIISVSGSATAEQLQQILDGINTAKSSASEILAEADALDEPETK